MGKYRFAVFINAGDHIAIHDELIYAAQEIAVERHAVRIGRILFRSFRAVRLRHAHGKQQFGSGFRIFFAHQRRGGFQPRRMIFIHRKYGEQFYIGAADRIQIIAIRRFGKAEGRKQAQNRQHDRKKFPVHNEPPELNL